MKINGRIVVTGAIRRKTTLIGLPEVVSWVTDGGLLGSVENLDLVGIELEATSSKSTSINYTVIAGTLPDGLHLEGAIISGQPTGHGMYTFTIRASSGSSFADRDFTIIVEPRLSWVTGALLPNLEAGQEAEQWLVATMSDGSPVTYQILSGQLPLGTAISSDGLLSGTVAIETEEGSFTFIVRASSQGKEEDREFILPIIAPPVWMTGEGEIASVSLDEEFSTVLSVESAREVTFEIIEAPPETVSVKQV